MESPKLRTNDEHKGHHDKTSPTDTQREKMDKPDCEDQSPTGISSTDTQGEKMDKHDSDEQNDQSPTGISSTDSQGEKTDKHDSDDQSPTGTSPGSPQRVKKAKRDEDDPQSPGGTSTGSTKRVKKLKRDGEDHPSPGEFIFVSDDEGADCLQLKIENPRSLQESGIISLDSYQYISDVEDDLGQVEKRPAKRNGIAAYFKPSNNVKTGSEPLQGKREDPKPGKVICVESDEDEDKKRKSQDLKEKRKETPGRVMPSQDVRKQVRRTLDGKVICLDSDEEDKKKLKSQEKKVERRRSSGLERLFQAVKNRVRKYEAKVVCVESDDENDKEEREKTIGLESLFQAVKKRVRELEAKVICVDSDEEEERKRLKSRDAKEDRKETPGRERLVQEGRKEVQKLDKAICAESDDNYDPGGDDDDDDVTDNDDDWIPKPQDIKRRWIEPPVREWQPREVRNESQKVTEIVISVESKDYDNKKRKSQDHKKKRKETPRRGKESHKHKDKKLKSPVIKKKRATSSGKSRRSETKVVRKSHKATSDEDEKLKSPVIKKKRGRPPQSETKVVRKLEGRSPRSETKAVQKSGGRLRQSETKVVQKLEDKEISAESDDNEDEEDEEAQKLKSQAIRAKRESLFLDVKKRVRVLEEFCIACGSSSVKAGHPLFVGGLCEKCLEWFLTWGFQTDEDGRQCYCSICCSGEEILVCSSHRCWRCYCLVCVDLLEGEGCGAKARQQDPWRCYLCRQTLFTGMLQLRRDWQTRLQALLTNQHDLEYDPPPLYLPIPLQIRRPIRVLSLFDGVATGLLVLKCLGIKVDCYYASEVSENAIAVSKARHPGVITHVGDVQNITRKQIEEWGPFDLLLGGSPCNDLSGVNPYRKGLYEGTGQLFFDFPRLMNKVRPKPGQDRPFFWLYENVVSMANHFKKVISNHLETNPVNLDAGEVSAARRQRLYWGNLPGMDRSMVATEQDNLELQDCLEPGRKANYKKMMTITTKSGSMRRSSDGKLPVATDCEDDMLLCSELERVFGFPPNYTNLKSIGRTSRLELLGKSWSVPVIRHLLAPLKEYFTSE